MIPDSKVHGENMGPIWGRQDPGGPHVGPMNFAIWVYNWCNYLSIPGWKLFHVSTGGPWTTIWITFITFIYKFRYCKSFIQVFIMTFDQTTKKFTQQGSLRSSLISLRPGQSGFHFLNAWYPVLIVISDALFCMCPKVLYSAFVQLAVCLLIKVEWRIYASPT